MEQASGIGATSPPPIQFVDIASEAGLKDTFYCGSDELKKYIIECAAARRVALDCPRCWIAASPSLDAGAGTSSQSSGKLVVGMHPEIDWPAIAAAGNVYRHEYEVVDEALVWHTVQHGLAALRTASDEEFHRL